MILTLLAMRWTRGTVVIRLPLFIAASLFVTSLSSARVAHVPDDFPTIQAAINQSETGDTIRVATGVYSGAGNVALNFAGRGLALIGSGSELSILDGTDSGGLRCLELADSEPIEIEGFAIRNFDVFTEANNPELPPSGAVLVSDGSVVFRDCSFRNNGAHSREGVSAHVDVAPGGSARFVSCRFEGTRLNESSFPYHYSRTQVTVHSGGIGTFESCVFTQSRGTALRISDGSAQMDRCFIFDNQGDGIVLADGDILVSSSTVSGNRGAGIATDTPAGGQPAPATLRIQDSIIWGNIGVPIRFGDGGISSNSEISCSILELSRIEGAGGNVSHLNNLEASPRFVGGLAKESLPPELWFDLLSSISPALPENSFCGHRIGAGNRGIEFRDSYPLQVPDPYPTIAAAFDAAASTDSIRVTGDIQWGVNEQVVLTGERRLTIQGTGGRVMTEYRSRPLFVLSSGSSLALFDLEFENAEGLAEVSASTLTVERCQVRRLTGRVVQASDSSEISLNACEFEGNAGVLSLDHSVGTVSECECWSSRPVPVFVENGVFESRGETSALRVRDCFVHDNTSLVGPAGFFLSGGHHEFENTIFERNSSRSGEPGFYGYGAIGELIGTDVVLRGCEIIRPSSELTLLRAESSVLLIDSCLVAGGTSTMGLISATNTSVRITQSTITSNATSPVFETDDSDFHLDRSIVHNNCDLRGQPSTPLSIGTNPADTNVSCSIIDTALVADPLGIVDYTNVLSTDPGFVDPGFCGGTGDLVIGNYHLRSDSPAAGENNDCCVDLGFFPLDRDGEIECSSDTTGSPPDTTDVPDDDPQDQGPPASRLERNPISSSLALQIARHTGGPLTLSIYSVTGSQIARRSVDVDAQGRVVWNIDGLGLPSGTYQIYIEGKQRRESLRFTVLH